MVYGQSGIVYKGPMYASATASVVGTTATVTIAFTPDSVAGGIGLVNTQCPPPDLVPASNCSAGQVWAVWVSVNTFCDASSDIVADFRIGRLGSRGKHRSDSGWERRHLYCYAAFHGP